MAHRLNFQVGITRGSVRPAVVAELRLYIGEWIGHLLKAGCGKRVIVAIFVPDQTTQVVGIKRIGRKLGGVFHQQRNHRSEIDSRAERTAITAIRVERALALHVRVRERLSEAKP